MLEMFGGMLALSIGIASTQWVQAPPANYDEAKVPAYTLPDPLATDEGPVETPQQWMEQRRPQLVQLFEEHVYGAAPKAWPELSSELAHPPVDFLDGKAWMYEVSVRIGLNGPALTLLVVRPKQDEPAPAFLGLNFRGNHSVHEDPRIVLNDRWMPNDSEGMVLRNRAGENSRGTAASRWPIDLLIDRGYALVTLYYGDIDPDYDDGFQNGVHPLFYGEGQRQPEANQWGSIAAWAWGLSRAMDYIEHDTGLDHRRVAVIGHSRLGKTALWAGAQDDRFALVISNNSGCGGAALSRREFGESVFRINSAFPHWFCDNFQHYNQRVHDLPVDQHALIALIAPRPVYVASANDDLWADPKGEFLSLKHAAPVYRLLGAEDASLDEPPPVNQPISRGPLGYHCREGKHDITRYDWEQYLQFADQQFKLP